MRCLVVHAHPDPASYSRALRDRAVESLEGAGHEVELLDLYAIHAAGWDPNLSAEEHRAYETIAADHPDPAVADHIRALRAADTLVVIYPTWWSGLPAVLKGWLERTLLPGVAFTLSPGDGGATAVTPALDNITRLVGITTYGSSRTDVRLLGDAGRRTITRTVRLVCARRCRTTWLGLHRLDGIGDAERAAFLDQVGDTLGRLDRPRIPDRVANRFPDRIRR